MPTRCPFIFISAGRVTSASRRGKRPSTATTSSGPWVRSASRNTLSPSRSTSTITGRYHSSYPPLILFTGYIFVHLYLVFNCQGTICARLGDKNLDLCHSKALSYLEHKIYVSELSFAIVLSCFLQNHFSPMLMGSFLSSQWTTNIECLLSLIDGIEDRGNLCISLCVGHLLSFCTMID
jgi:hypothetical protein